MGIRRGSAWGWLAGVTLTAAASAAHAQHTDGCPIGAQDRGGEVQRTFTDSKGRTAQVFFNLPVGHDPNVPSGVLMYFHGNDADPTDSYVAPLFEIQDRADAHGLIAAGLKSQGTYTDPSGVVRRQWVNSDEWLLVDLLNSDFGGCFKIDKTRIYLEGASQGTCFLAAVLSSSLWRDFQGGVLGLCGCWGTGDYDYPVNVPQVRNRFKVYVENTTEDFLLNQGVMGLDIYKYNFGLNVRADLARPGQHCENMQANNAAALSWMIDGTSYADPDANQPHWQVLDTQHNGLEDVAYDDRNGRFVVATERPDLGADVLESIEQVRRNMFADDPQGFLDWRIANYPQYAVPPVLILTTVDYGVTFSKVARRDSTASGSDDLYDLAVAPDGSILVVQGLGVRKVNQTTGTIDPFAFDGKLVYGLDRDGDENLFAHGALIGVQRSRDSGATWAQLTVPVRNQFAQWIVGVGGGYLTVIGNDGKIYYSQDAGDTFMSAALPTGTLVDFAAYEKTFYAVLADGTLQVSQNGGSSWQLATVPSGSARAVETLANGDAVVSAAADAYAVGLVYRTKDAGQTWARERGAHNDARMEFSSGTGTQAMMVTTRGIFRFSTGALLDIGNPSSTGSGGSGGAGTSSQGGGSGGGQSGAAGSGATGGAPGATNGGGCGCRLVPTGRSPALALLGVAALALFVRRRRAPR